MITKIFEQVFFFSFARATEFDRLKKIRRQTLRTGQVQLHCVENAVLPPCATLLAAGPQVRRKIKH